MIEKTKKALIIDDDLRSRKLLRDILEIKFTVREANSAETALKLLDCWLPDVILLDLQLGGMDGISFLDELRCDARTAAISVVIVSAHAYENQILEAADHGCSVYITKPIVENPYAFAERIAAISQTELMQYGSP